MTKTIVISAITTLVILTTAIVINKQRIKKSKKSLFA